jgi:integrase
MGIVMLSWKNLQLMPLTKYCKGFIVAARIYADTSGNKCQCGGVFSARVPHPDDKSVLVPRCDKCNEYPPLFHIDADALDINGGKIRVKIRNDQNNTRLDKISKVMFTLERIQQEIMEGTFDVRKYDSKASRERYRFDNYIAEYLAYQEVKLSIGKLSPKGLRDKIGLINRELMPFFKNVEINRINNPMISRFKDTYKDKFRTRDLALGELKAILNQAVKDEMINTCPKFDPIPRSRTRKEVISMDLAKQTIALMHKEMYRDMYTLLTIYPMRPCELRALKWENIDFVKDEFTITHHFSDEVRIAGRKSIKEDEDKGRITYPMNAEARIIFNKYRPQTLVSMNWKEQYVFIGRFGNHISGETLADAWRNARKKLGHSFEAYECRHATTSELYNKLNGDLVKLKNVSGHTNVSTLERYVRSKTDMRDLF